MRFFERSSRYIGIILTLLGMSLANFSPIMLVSGGSPVPALTFLSRVDTQDRVPSEAIQFIPGQNDWDTGTLALSSGAEGQWDRYLWGGFANSLIKKGNTFYLYYQGSPSYDNTCDSVAHRAIGVATSMDGIHWVKSPNNPVITWSNQGSIEKGRGELCSLAGQ